MEGFRKFGLWAAGLLITPLIGLALFTFVFHQTVGNAEYIKTTLSETNIYAGFGVFAQEQAIKSPELKNQPLVIDAVEEASKEQYTRPVVEDTVDQTFLVLSGDKPAGELAINFIPVQQAFLKSLGSDLSSQLTSLPPCPTTALAEAQIENPLEATCLPPGVSVEEFIAEIKETIFESNDILKSGTITLTEANSDKDKSATTQQDSEQTGPINPESPEEGLELLSSVYQFSKIMLPIAIVLSTLSAAGIIFLSRPRIKGVRRAGWILLVNGFFTGLLSLLLNRMAASFAVDRAADNVTITAALEDATRLTVLDITALSRNIAICLFVVGLGMIIAATIILRKNKPADEEKEKPKQQNNNNTSDQAQPTPS